MPNHSTAASQQQPGEQQPGKHGWMREVLSIREDHADSFLRASWATAGNPIDDADRLWKQYLVFLDLFKTYLDIAWKVSVWYYAITGAILSYFFTNMNAPSAGPLDLSLVFLSLASLGFVHHHIRAARNLHEMTIWVDYIAQSLELPGRPHVEFAAAFLLVNSILIGLVALACTGYLLLVRIAI